MPYDYHAIYNEATCTFTKGYLVKYDSPDSSFDKINEDRAPNSSIEFFKTPHSTREKSGAFKVSHCHPHQPSINFNLYSSDEDKSNLVKLLKQYHMCILNLSAELDRIDSIILKKIIIKELSQDKATIAFLNTLVSNGSRAV